MFEIKSLSGYKPDLQILIYGNFCSSAVALRMGCDAVQLHPKHILIYGNCISVGAIGWIRVSCGFGKYPQAKRETETTRIRIARNNLIFLLMVCTATFMSPLYAR